MINEQPNMGRKQIFDELPIPSKVEEGLLAKLTYRGIFIIVKLLLDIRLNLVRISEGRVIKPKGNTQRFQKTPKEKKPDNPIKGIDHIKLKEGSVKKGGVNDIKDVNKPDFEPKGQGGKTDEETKS